MTAKRMFFSGNAHPILAQKLANHLHLSLAQALVSKFSDGETRIEILEKVKNHEVYIVQSLSPPANDHLMELLLLIDACRRGFASKITAVIPYFAYARQDKPDHSGALPVQPITAKLVADLLERVGVNAVYAVDLHTEQQAGVFSVPIEMISALPLFAKDIRAKHYPRPIIISPDTGGVLRAQKLAKLLGNARLAVIDKRRPKPNLSEVVEVMGDIKNHHCIIVDDMVDTAGTLCKTAQALKEKGAKKIVAYCTHAILSGRALENLQASPIEELVVTDTLPLSEKAQTFDRIRPLSIVNSLAQALDHHKFS